MAILTTRQILAHLLMAILTTRCVAATIRTTYQLKDQKLDPSSVTPNVLSANLGKRWRAERNFWIAFITFTLWW